MRPSQPWPPTLLLLGLLVSAPQAMATLQFNGSSIEQEIAASAAVMSELTKLAGNRRTISQALYLCMRQSPDLFCAWFSRRLFDHSNNSSSPAVITEDNLLVTCFNEVKFACNLQSDTDDVRKSISSSSSSSSSRPWHTPCDGCTPCRRLPGQHVVQECYCSCMFSGASFDSWFRKGQSLQQQISGYNSDIAGFYPCAGLCDRRAACASGSDEALGICRVYNRNLSSPWAAAGLTLGIAAVLVTLSYLLNALLKGVLLSLCPKWRRVRRLCRRCARRFSYCYRLNRRSGAADVDAEPDDDDEEDNDEAAAVAAFASSAGEFDYVRARQQEEVLVPLRQLRPPPYDAAVAAPAASVDVADDSAPPPPYSERDERLHGLAANYSTTW